MSDKVYCPDCCLPGKDVTTFDDMVRQYLCQNTNCTGFQYSAAQALTKEEARQKLTPQAAQEGSGSSRLAEDIQKVAGAAERLSAREARHSSSRQDWGTPPAVLEAGREFLYEFELDPASDAEHNQRVQAKRFYTKEDNGLLLPWEASTLWVNPPYGLLQPEEVPEHLRYPRQQRHARQPFSSQGVWVQKLLHEHKEDRAQSALLLVNAETSASWFDPLWEYPICFTGSRLRFINPDTGKPGGSPTHGSAIVFIGSKFMVGSFAASFREIGRVTLDYGALPRYVRYLSEG